MSLLLNSIYNSRGRRAPLVDIWKAVFPEPVFPYTKKVILPGLARSILLTYPLRRDNLSIEGASIHLTPPCHTYKKSTGRAACCAHHQ